jgi:arylsulfatase A-like enzyme
VTGRKKDRIAVRGHDFHLADFVPGRRLVRALALVALAAQVACAADEAPLKPNIVLILLDDLGYGDLGAYGNDEAPTPQIDALARQGLRFSDFHSNASVCSPTRASLLTGRYPQRLGIEGTLKLAENRRGGLSLREVTLPEVLGPAGYATAIFGKWHLGYTLSFHPLRQGFGTFRGFLAGGIDYHSHVNRAGEVDWWHDEGREPEPGYTTDLLTDYTILFIEQHRERPFFVYLSYQAVHYPLQTRDDAPYRVAGRSYWRTRREGGGGQPRVAYREMLRALDEGVGRIVATLHRLGLGRRTLVFLTSDNGGDREVARHGPLRGFKATLFEGGHRVPAIAWWPGRIPAGSVASQTAMTMDLFPTVAGLAGATLPDGLRIDGVDLGPLLLEGRELPERTLFWRFAGGYAVRRGGWKLIVTQRYRGLFDLAVDPGEGRNLAGSHSDRVARLAAEFARWEDDVLDGVEWVRGHSTRLAK